MKKDKPCWGHKLAFGNARAPELEGMRKAGIKFSRCKRCGWMIKKPKISEVQKWIRDREAKYDSVQ